MITGIRAVCFDTAGTLWRAEPSLDERVAAACKSAGGEVRGNEVHYQRTRLGDELQPRYSQGHCRSEAQADAYWQEFYTLLLQALAVPAEHLPRLAGELRAMQFNADTYRLYPDVVPLLTRLREQSDLHLGVIANREGPEHELLNRFELGGLFHSCTLSSEEGTEKPESRIFRLAAARAGVAPEELLYVGNDLLEDMTGAVVAGCQAVLVDRSARYSTSYLQWQRVRRLDDLLKMLAPPSPVLD